MKDREAHGPGDRIRHISLDDPVMLRQYIVEGTIWRLPPQFWQVAIDAVGKGIVTREELLSHAPASIKDKL